LRNPFGIQRFGRIDVLVNNAGFGLFGLFEATPRAKVREQFEVNVFGVMDVMRAVLPHFRANRGGTILTVSSGAGVFTLPMLSLYCVSKFALEDFSESLSYELASQGIAVKVVEPGGVLSTNFGRRSAEEAAGNPSIAAYDAFATGVSAVFDRRRASRSATEADVARVSFAAASDGTDQLRYVATEDIKPLVRARRETSEREYMAFMRSQFLPKPERHRPPRRRCPVLDDKTGGGVRAFSGEVHRLVSEGTVMRLEVAKQVSPLAPQEYHRLVPLQPAAASYRLGWAGLEAVLFNDLPDAEIERPSLTHHTLVLFNRPPDVFEVGYEGERRHLPPPAGAVAVVPAGTPSRWHWRGRKGSLHVFLEPDLVTRVAAEEFGLDTARWAVPPLDCLDQPQVRAAKLAVDAELTAGGLGGPLAAESLANFLAVHLLRHVLAPRQPTRRRYGAFPRARLRAVVDYVEEHLDASPTLEQMAAVARLSPNCFASQFQRATGLPPHQYVIARRVERAKELLQSGADLSLAEVAAHAGFSDQSQFSHHFKRLLGVTPGQFRTRIRNA
jgi:NAD(P)-dependent dehydrogenase (short-subunit alcohol dehydrogenase family)/AraC-like DNA-binding protein